MADVREIKVVRKWVLVKWRWARGCKGLAGFQGCSCSPVTLPGRVMEGLHFQSYKLKLVDSDTEKGRVVLHHCTAGFTTE
jgi:hypothetical protein